ncbi:hypothetical protein NP233_g5901 [Leucocoprinus birnbaumii]|uniref:TFIIS-type domain-containing protein n=1 Tax=Leucocoprinus birnbaumii TaxID=56174 RepID=A0AAD5YQI0_9AGAR|nr:hypothetical protein NP233_g5901 [Leucocoprinus birnbaumii]
MTSRTRLKRKEVDDVLGGDEMWAHADQTQASCDKCNHDRAYFYQLQIRSADEPMTTFYRCFSGVRTSAVPCELLHEIFSIYVSDHDTGNHYQVMSRLCSVSRQWRDVATREAKFWLKVDLDLDKGYPPVPLLKLWLERSDEEMIGVSISCPSRDLELNALSVDWVHQSHFDQTCATLGPSIPRWESLRVNHHAPSHQNLLGDFFSKIPFELAVELSSLDVGTCLPSSEQEQIFQALEKAPALTTFTTRWFCDKDASALSHLSWERLVHVEIYAMLHWQTITPFLTRCSSLVTLQLDSHFPLDESSAPSSINLPQLHTLAICGGYEVFQVVARFKCSRLRILSLDARNQIAEGDDYDDFFDPFLEFLYSEERPLRVLTINLVFMTRSMLVKLFFLKALINLTIMRVTFHAEGVDSNCLDSGTRELLRRAENPSWSMLKTTYVDGEASLSWYREDKMEETFDYTLGSDSSIDLRERFDASFDIDSLTWSKRLCLYELIAGEDLQPSHV